VRSARALAHGLVCALLPACASTPTDALLDAASSAADSSAADGGEARPSDAEPGVDVAPPNCLELGPVSLDFHAAFEPGDHGVGSGTVRNRCWFKNATIVEVSLADGSAFTLRPVALPRTLAHDEEATFVVWYERRSIARDGTTLALRSDDPDPIVLDLLAELPPGPVLARFDPADFGPVIMRGPSADGSSLCRSATQSVALRLVPGTEPGASGPPLSITRIQAEKDLPHFEWVALEKNGSPLPLELPIEDPYRRPPTPTDNKPNPDPDGDTGSHVVVIEVA